MLVHSAVNFFSLFNRCSGVRGGTFRPSSAVVTAAIVAKILNFIVGLFFSNLLFSVVCTLSVFSKFDVEMLKSSALNSAKKRR